jgi:hypothetical protein
VVSNGATVFDIKNQTNEDLPTLEIEGLTVWDDLRGQKWPKFLTKTCPMLSIKKETSGKMVKIDPKKTYLRSRHQASINLAKT